MGVFWDKATILRSSRLRVVYVVAFLCAFALTELGRFVYRPYAYRSGLNDFGIADTMGNSLGVVAQIFLLLAVMHSNWRQGLRVVLFVTCGYIAYAVKYHGADSGEKRLFRIGIEFPRG